ncbi:MAG: ubiquinol-cytochrome c reductase iron-sulfur subunit [Betaproteobacteria bacterium]|nr:ubiquinol-cytochrome c reductase iron-sulfur subunit [Betaproteobacteria bacterium]
MCQNTTEIPDESRRDFLGALTASVAGAGAIAACVPFVKSMSPSSDVLDKATVEIDISKIGTGQEKTVAWQGKPVFILHRTPEMISEMKSSKGGKDPEPDSKRIQHPEWLIVVGICTHLGCVPNKTSSGWFCPCHGSVYDNSGRIITGPAPKNLILPPYHFVSDEKIVIGKA